MLDKKISVSEQVDNLLTTEAKLIFTWAIPHSDDLGLLPYSHKTLKALIIPMWDIRLDTFSEYIKDIEKQGLFTIFEHKSEKFYRLVNFAKYQTLKKDRKPNTCLNGVESWEDVETLGFQMEDIGFQMEDNGNPSKEKRSKEKRSKEKKLFSTKVENNIYTSYKNKINSKAILTSNGKKNIQNCLRNFSEEQFLKAIDNKSKDKWFMRHNSNRGITWFFSSLTRIARYIEEEPKTEQSNVIS